MEIVVGVAINLDYIFGGGWYQTGNRWEHLLIVGIVPPHRRSDNTKWFVADATDFLIVENEKQQSDGHVVLELALSNRVEYLSDQIPSRKIIF